MRSPRTLRRMLTAVAFAFASLLALVVGVLLVVQDASLTRSVALSAIGLNIVASVVFGVVFAVGNTWAQNIAIEDNLEERFTLLSRDLQSRLAATNRVFLPEASYPAIDPSVTGSYGDAYNLDLTNSFREAGSFSFFGLSGWQLGARIMRAPGRPKRVRVALLDPRDRQAVLHGTAPVQRSRRVPRQSVDDIMSAYRQDFLESLIGLFDCRVICPVELVLHHDVSAYRYVLMENAIYVTWYFAPGSEGHETPASYRFGPDTFVFQSMELDMLRRFDRAADRIVFKAEDGDDTLVDHLRCFTGEAIGVEQVRALRRKYWSDIRRFARYLDTIASAVGASTAEGSPDSG